MFVMVVAGCLKKDNPYYCADRPDHNCTQDGGVHCTDNTQCPALAPVCDMPATICVQCTAAQHAACTSATPICRADEMCHGCELDGECPGSNVCLPDGACADVGDVAYVNSAMGTDNQTCSMGLPCTKIMKALGTNRPYLKLQGAFDEAVAINNRSVTILAAPGTMLTRGTPGNILEVNGTSNVKIYDLAINDATDGAAVSAMGPSQSLTLGRVSMSGNRGPTGAIVVTGGAINVSRSKVFNNPSGGISVMAAQFDIENNFITGNGDLNMSGYGGILLVQTNTGTRVLTFNTIAGNMGLNVNPSGISCSTITQDINLSNNIVYGNSTGSQVGGPNCSWTYSDVGPDGVPGNLSTDPMFIGSGDFHLKANSPVINQADPNATLTIDIDGDPRPQDGRRDIGADEYRMPSASSSSSTANGADHDTVLMKP
jgi:hypothetical protein